MVLEVPHFPSLGIGKDLGALHVGVGRIGEGGVIEARQGSADGGIPWLAGGDIDGGADANEVEGFARGVERHADTSGGAGVGFDEAPVHSVGRAVEGHPVGHGVASTGLALAAAVFCFGGDAVGSSGCGGGGFSDGDGGGEEDFVALDDIHFLSTGADGDTDGGAVGGLSDWGVEREAASSGSGAGAGGCGGAAR